MNKDLRTRPRVPLAALVLLALGVATGCGDSNAPVKEDPAALSKRVDSAKELRAYFDKTNGNYDALTPADKDALNKITGSEANSRNAFGHMIPNGGGMPPSR